MRKLRIMRRFSHSLIPSVVVALLALLDARNIEEAHHRDAAAAEMATLGMTFYEKGGWGGPFDHMEGDHSTAGGGNRQPISRFWPVGTF